MECGVEVSDEGAVLKIPWPSVANLLSERKSLLRYGAARRPHNHNKRCRYL
jgi:hypothetical protein